MSRFCFAPTGRSIAFRRWWIEFAIRLTGFLGAADIPYNLRSGRTRHAGRYGSSAREQVCRRRRIWPVNKRRPSVTCSRRGRGCRCLQPLEVIHMAMCKGKRPEKPDGHCGGTLYKSGKCGSVGWVPRSAARAVRTTGSRPGRARSAAHPGRRSRSKPRRSSPSCPSDRSFHSDHSKWTCKSASSRFLNRLIPLSTVN